MDEKTVEAIEWLKDRKRLVEKNISELELEKLDLEKRIAKMQKKSSKHRVEDIDIVDRLENSAKYGDPALKQLKLKAADEITRLRLTVGSVVLQKDIIVKLVGYRDTAEKELANAAVSYEVGKTTLENQLIFIRRHSVWECLWYISTETETFVWDFEAFGWLESCWVDRKLPLDKNTAIYRRLEQCLETAKCLVGGSK